MTRQRPRDPREADRALFFLLAALIPIGVLGTVMDASGKPLLEQIAAYASLLSPFAVYGVARSVFALYARRETRRLQELIDKVDGALEPSGGRPDAETERV